MGKVLMEIEEGIARLTLQNGTTNAIDLALAEELSEAFEDLPADTKGLVLAGNAKFFSIGLNLPDLVELDRDAMAGFWGRFVAMVLKLYELPMPTVCALSGHAIAGGAILAAACDFRIGSNPARKIGLNELEIGIPVPYFAQLMLERIVPASVLRRMLFGSNLFTYEEAFANGLLDEVCPEESLGKQAMRKIAGYNAASLQAYSEMKMAYQSDVTDRIRATLSDRNEAFLNAWFSEQSMAALRAAAARF